MVWIRPDGYVGCNHDGKQYLEHRLIMEIYLGRKLTRREQVHHKDGNKKNNALENLQLVDISDHTVRHNTGRPRPKWWGTSHVCIDCGGTEHRGTGWSSVNKERKQWLCERCHKKRWRYSHRDRVRASNKASYERNKHKYKMVRIRA